MFFYRLKDGNGQAFYPRSSFVINCTGNFVKLYKFPTSFFLCLVVLNLNVLFSGDVCKGDVVLFRQQVYDK